MTDKLPAQMGVAGGAEGDLPGMAGKPGEFDAGGALWLDTGRPLKTTDFKGNAGRVEEGMLVAAIDTDGLVLAGDKRAAGTAEQSLLLVIVGLILRRGRRIHLGRPQLDRP